MGATRKEIGFRFRADKIMCRSIKQLRHANTPLASDDDMRAAALQFVRKVSGYRAPSRANQVVFDRAVEAITAATHELLGDLQTTKAGETKSGG